MIMPSVYKVRVGKQGRIVLPKGLREAYGVDTGNEAIIIAHDGELTIRLRKVSEDPLNDLIEVSKGISIGLSAEELKKKVDEERVKQFLGA
jgi:AbrB family looped-hinge helix DNA binding protein